MDQKKLSQNSLFPTAIRSIDFAIPFNFPDKMLSNFSVFKSKSSQQEEEDRNTGNEVVQIANQDAEALEFQLGLRIPATIRPQMSQKSQKKQSMVPQSPLRTKTPKLELRPQHKQGVYEDTKNLLRNFGNAQNQFILYNKRAAQIVEQSTNQPQKFYAWVRKLKLQNFEQFKRVWSGNNGSSKLFTRLYKQLCWKFYVQQAVSYVMMSRMKNETTKMTHLKYIYRFLQGIRDPQNFKYFKKQ